jgi:hypothetical protein
MHIRHVMFLDTGSTQPSDTPFFCCSQFAVARVEDSFDRDGNCGSMLQHVAMVCDVACCCVCLCCIVMYEAACDSLSTPSLEHFRRASFGIQRLL